VSEAWGGVGWHYAVCNDEPSLHEGWEEQLGSTASAFDHRHERFASDARTLLAKRSVLVSDAPSSTHLVHECLFGLRSNRYTVQPLRFDTNNVSSGTSFKRRAAEEYNKLLALVRRHAPPCAAMH
jgi:hypothetical protein